MEIEDGLNNDLCVSFSHSLRDREVDGKNKKQSKMLKTLNESIWSWGSINCLFLQKEKNWN